MLTPLVRYRINIALLGFWEYSLVTVCGIHIHKLSCMTPNLVSMTCLLYTEALHKYFLLNKEKPLCNIFVGFLYVLSYDLFCSSGRIRGNILVNIYYIISFPQYNETYSISCCGQIIILYNLSKKKKFSRFSFTTLG
jgi:hypothetical protein